jgi:hypothetical protein
MNFMNLRKRMHNLLNYINNHDTNLCEINNWLIKNSKLSIFIKIITN